MIDHATIAGAATPPMSSFRPTRNHSPCCQARSDFLNDSGIVTACVGRVESGRVPVGVGEGLGQRSLGELGRLGEHLANGLAIEVPEVTGGQSLLELEHLEQVELEIPDIALVMAHA